jgi:predicted GNAT family acetyltransferase
MAPVTHNESAQQFEVTLGGATAVIVYRRQPGTIIFVHTEVPPAMEGQGIAAKLAAAGLEFARAQGLKVVPLCPYVIRYLAKHQEYIDLVHEHHRVRVAR